MDLQNRLQDDMKSALKAGDKERLGVIRMVLSDVKNADLLPGKPSAEAIVSAYAKKLRKSQEEYQKYNKSAEVEQLGREIAIVESYLPKRADEAETGRLIDAFLAANAFTEKQAGQAMGAFLKQHGQAVDPAVVNRLLRERLKGK